MKSLLLCLLTLTAAASAADNVVSGTIFFSNGQSQDFFELVSLDHVAQFEKIRESRHDMLVYTDKGKLETADFSELSLMTVKLYEPFLDRWRGEALKHVVLYVEGKRHKVNASIDRLTSITVRVVDPESGKLTQRTYPFAEDRGLHIRMIRLEETNVNMVANKVKASIGKKD